MKTGRSLTEVATELERQAKLKRDYIADTRKLRLAVAADGKTPQGNVTLEGINGGMRLRPIAHRQMAEALQIPAVYYDRMLENEPELLTLNVNRWLQAQPAKKMVRTLDGEVRALLSDSYRPLDNFDLANAVLPKLLELDAEIKSSEVTENRFYLQAVTPQVQAVVGKIKPGLHQYLKPGDDDLIQAGVVVSNSEVGQGALAVEEMTWRLACYNGAIHMVAVRKAHLGRGSRGGDAIEDAREFFRDETRIADDHAFFLKVRDAVAAMFTTARLEKRAETYRAAADKLLTAAPAEVIEVTAKKYNLTEAEKGNVLTHLIQGGDLSAWGLANAITRASSDVEDYDRAVELERLGGSIVELPAHDWKILAGKTPAA